MVQTIPFGYRTTADQVLAGVDLARKRVVVTECSSPIGFAAMKALSANGARIVGLARTADVAEAACSAAGLSLTPLGCNPADPPSIDAAMESIRGQGPVDAVVVNCHELECFADHIAQFVLVNRISELVRSDTGRIVIGGNDIATIASAHVKDVKFDNLGGERLYDSYAFKGQAELATALFAKELSRRLDARGVAVNSFGCRAIDNRHPRGVRSAAQLIHSVARYFTRSPERRAATPVLLAASPLVAGLTGEYWSNCQVSPGNPLRSDIGLAKRLWDVSAQVAAMVFGSSALPQICLEA
jgi:NAD(P)-dependent dehydrogenase (short-subunit alcohol dehydrogenase family)